MILGFLVWIQVDLQVQEHFLFLVTHPNLPKGKEYITPVIEISPHLASPEGEGLIPLTV